MFKNFAPVMKIPVDRSPSPTDAPQVKIIPPAVILSSLLLNSAVAGGPIEANIKQTEKPLDALHGLNAGSGCAGEW